MFPTKYHLSTGYLAFFQWYVSENHSIMYTVPSEVYFSKTGQQLPQIHIGTLWWLYQS